MIVNLFKKIKLLDSFGSTVYFKINGKDNYQTILGGFLNIIVMIVFFCHFSFNFKKFIEKSDPDIYSVDKFEDSKIQISSNEYLFHLELPTLLNEFNFDFLNYFDLKYTIYIGGVDFKDYKLKPCNFSEYPKILNHTSEYDRLFNESIKLCPDLGNNNFKYNIEFSTFRIYRKSEVNIEEEKLEKIKGIFKKPLKIYLGTRRNIFTPDDFDTPIKNYIDRKEFNLKIDEINQLKLILGNQKLRLKQ